MSVFSTHRWMLSVIGDLADYAESYGLVTVAAPLKAAQDALVQALATSHADDPPSREERDFVEALSALVAYAEDNRLPATSLHLQYALNAHIHEQGRRGSPAAPPENASPSSARPGSAGPKSTGPKSTGPKSTGPEHPGRKDGAAEDDDADVLPLVTRSDS